MHLHGVRFYVVGRGVGNFNNVTDPLTYNLYDPPEANTAAVPKDGWMAIRFYANNPGIFFLISLYFRKPKHVLYSSLLAHKVHEYTFN